MTQRRTYARTKGAVWIALLLASASCDKKEAPPAPPPPDVLVTEAIQRDVPIYQEAIGQSRGLLNVDIRARVEGFLDSAPYKPGELVKTGDVLFTIDPQPFEASLAEAEGSLAEADARWGKTKADVARYRPLAEQDAISRQELDNAVASERAAVAAVEAAKAVVKRAKLNLGYTKVYSPVDGLAGFALPAVGDLVGPGPNSLLTTVSTLDPILVRCSIPERDYLRYYKRQLERTKDVRIQDGDTNIQMTLADGSIFPYPGKFTSADRLVDPNTGTLMLEVEFANPQRVVRPGQFARVRVKVDDKKNAVLVPQRAVQELQSIFSIVVVGSDGKAEFRTVQPGERVGSLWVIDQGVKAGERVIVEGLQKVRDGMVVNAKTVPIESQTAASSPGK